jgi:hypothetical protein
MKAYVMLWASLLSAAFTLRWGLDGSWQRYQLTQSAMTSQTGDCRNASALDAIDIAARNADLLFRRGRIDSLVADGEGCYELGTEVMVNSILRTADSRMIYYRYSWAKVEVAMILTTRYEQFSGPKRRYAARKFKDRAADLHYQTVMLAVAPSVRPEPPTLVPRQHPGAVSLSLADALAKAETRAVYLVHFDDKRPTSDNAIRVAYTGPGDGIADPEAASALETPPAWLGGLPTDRPLVIVPTDETDLRGYNLVSLLMVSGFGRLYWVREGWQKPQVVPSTAPGLETVDCWRAAQLLDAGVPVADPAVIGGPALWLGEHEYDHAYYEAMRAVSKSNTLGGYWLPGGVRQLTWCQHHNPDLPADAAADDGG